MNITLRDAQLTDTTAIVQLIVDLAATSSEPSPITEGYVTQYLSSPTSKILLAEAHHRVIGLLSYSLRPDLYHAAAACLIEELVVQEAMRGQGVGSALLTELLSRLTAVDCAEVSVAAMPTNVRTRPQVLSFGQRCVVNGEGSG